MDFITVSVFVQNDPLTGGNPLAVFVEPGPLPASRMQAIARTMNLSETSFVTRVESNAYDVRIFTPAEELPFAGHPTIGTAWVLQQAGRLEGTEFTQHSPAGPTPLEQRGDLLWFTRTGSAQDDLEAASPDAVRRIAEALRLEERDIGMEAREVGRSGFFRPAIANGGFDQLMVPLRDVGALERCRPDAAGLAALTDSGMYCFTGVGAGRLRARAFFGPVGVHEDAATGSAAAALGMYLGKRVEAIELEILQGVEMGRPSVLYLKASGNEARVGGRSAVIYKGHLEAKL
jgi:trans-2,3-dihydro-3-hydroxyanthranilate isomerase